VPYVSFSDWVFDIGPEVALHIHKPADAPVLLLGHMLGGTITLATLYFAREFRTVHSIEIGAIFDETDQGGPAAQADFELTKGVPHPLILKDGKWLWATGDEAARRLTDVKGRERQARAYPMLDVVSLAAATAAKSVRIDFAVREEAGSSDR
jgi:hypothetical protein